MTPRRRASTTDRLTLALVIPAMAAIAWGGLGSPSASPASGTATNGLVAFEREAPAGDHTQADIYTVQPDGSGLERLNATPNLNEFGPVWGPAGKRIAFWRTAAPAGTGNLWLMDSDGSNQRRLTATVDARDPSWNPAGTRLAYDRASDDLFTLRVSDGGDRRQLTSGPALDFEPAWSPDGSRIAFTRGSSTGDPGDICLLDLSTLAIARVTHSAAYDHQVAWSPAGNRLVFERDLPGSSSIYSVRPDGSGPTRLTSGPHFDVGPTYSPDGRFIAFGSDRGSLLDDLWVMNGDGTGLHRLVGLTFSEGFPDWQSVSS